jgi:hypothetical protein
VRKSQDEGGLKDIMKILRQTLFIAIITICASFAAFAQSNRDDRQKTPPKGEKPPVVVVKEKGEKPKQDRPRDGNRNNDNRNKRPQSMNQNLFRLW